jgi:hypothetical protein
MLLLGLGCVALLVSFVFSSIRDSEVGREAMARARASQQVAEALGTPIEPG